VIALDREAELLQIIEALRAAGGLARRLDGGQEQRDQDGDDGNDDQQLDQGETTSPHQEFSSKDGRETMSNQGHAA